ncbi:MAG TPA: OmpA family protein [Verrucomicrobiae bacterium]|nr:OmpA family protein [Verrucomicrobiae bacterium]
MPEQAQRRAPAVQPVDSPSRGEEAFEELRQLIVGPEQRGLAEIRHRLDDPRRRAEDLSSVVAEAIHLRRRDGDDAALADALAPTVRETLRESVRKDPHDLADALFPVMGPAIRKSIAETLRSMLESFNEALEHSLSWRGIRWRIESLRTGKSFAEIVVMHSLVYRVEQLFLIHRKTGLVLNHVVAPAVATQDPTLVAGMLSAIQQFVHDSFDSPQDDSLGSLTVGELEVWVEQGPHAVLAAVIRGHAPASYRLALKENLEIIEGDFAAALASFQGDSGPFRAASERLHRLLETEYREKQESAKKPRLAIAAGIVLLVLALTWFGYSTYESSRWEAFSRDIASHPGIVVTGMEKSGGLWHIRGFRDPLAEDPAGELARNHLAPQSASFDLAPFYSLDGAIVLRRANRVLSPPESVQLTLHDGSLAALGSAPSSWIAKLHDRAPWIPGISTVDSSRLRNSDASSLESIILTFPLGRADLDPGQDPSIALAQRKIQSLLDLAATTGRPVAVSLIGHTDSTGVEGNNLVLSRQRADRVAALLLRAGVPNSAIEPRGVGPSQPLRPEDNEEGRHLNRSVTFLVHFAPPSPVH